MKIRLAAPLQFDSIVDGEGLRAVLWTQGCPHHCPSCHNPETWAYQGGFEADTEDLKKELVANKALQSGLTFTGGEPFWQPEACLEIAKFAKNELGFNLWSWSGFTYEQLTQGDNQARQDFLNVLDVLVDGPFILDQRDLSLLFRGSRNQRLLRLKNGEIQSIE